MGARSIEPRRSGWIIALAAIVLLAVALRFATLTRQSLWFDEAATHDVVRLGLSDMLRALPHRESNPPLFYLLEWGTTRVLGSGPFGLRALSALAGVLTVPVAGAIGSRLGGRRAALAAATLVAVNPLLVWYSQEARSYALVVLLSALGLLLFLHSLDDPRPRVLAWWALVSALALATHYFAAFVLLPQAMWLLWRHPQRKAAAGICGALLALSAALLPLLLAQRGNPYDIASGSIDVRLLQVPKQFLLGYRGPLPLLLGLVAAALVLVAAWLLVRETDRRVRQPTLGVAAIGGVAVLLPLLAAIVGVDYLNARNEIPALVPLAVALGIGCAASTRPRAGAAALAGLCALSASIVVAVAVDKDYQRADWKGVAAALGTSSLPRAIVGTNDQALGVYLPHLQSLSTAGATVREVDVVAVAGSAGPGDAPRLAPQVGTSLPQFGAPIARIVTPTYAILRFRVPQPVRVVPIGIAFVHFGPLAPRFDVLPAGR
jgi:mannosyltransferase